MNGILLGLIIFAGVMLAVYKLGIYLIPDDEFSIYKDYYDVEEQQPTSNSEVVCPVVQMYNSPPVSDRSMHNVLATLCYSWGGDAPEEVFWTLAEWTELVNITQGLELEVPDKDSYYAEEDASGTSIFAQRVDALADAMDNIFLEASQLHSV